MSTEWTFTLPRDHKGVFYYLSDAGAKKAYSLEVWEGDHKIDGFSIRPASGGITGQIEPNPASRVLKLRPFVQSPPGAPPSAVTIDAVDTSSDGIKEWSLSLDSGVVVLSLQCASKKPKSGAKAKRVKTVNRGSRPKKPGRSKKR